MNFNMNIKYMIIFVSILIIILYLFYPGDSADISNNKKNISKNTDIDFVHPNMYLNISEIETIKENVRSNRQPWKMAYEKIIEEANSELYIPNESVVYGGPIPPTGDIHDYFAGSVQNPNPERYDYKSAIAVSKAVRSLGIGYALTGDTQYADKAIQLIRVWAIDPTTKMNPIFAPKSNFIEYCITFPGMFYGADLIWNYQGWNPEDKKAFKSWVTQFIVSAKGWCGQPCDNPQNYENWRLVFISSAAVIAEDNKSLQYSFDRWKEIIESQMRSDGAMKNELNRTHSLSYSLYAINAMIQVAEISRHYGVDLYNYNLSDGRGIEKALDYYAVFAADSKSWPYRQDRYYNGENAALYELAYSFKQKSSYKSVIDKWGRPMYETRTMGPVTLTKGEK